MVTESRRSPGLGALSDAAPPEPARRRDAIAVVLLTLLAFALRASQLHQSLFGDEVLAFREIAGPSLAGTVHTVSAGAESSPPLFFVLAWLTSKLGDPTVWMRLPSLVLSTASVPAIAILGRETIGAGAGRLAAAIAAISPFAVFYGVEARPYATLAFCLTVSTLALVRAVRTGRRRDWTLYVLAAVAGAYTHYVAIYVLAVQAVWALWASRRQPRSAVIAHIAAVALYLPWLTRLHGTGLGAYAFLEPLTAAHVFDDVLRPVAGYPYAPLAAIPTSLGLVALGVCGVCGTGALVHRRRGTPPCRPERPTLPLLVALALATPVGLLLYSVLGTDIWTARSLIASAPEQALVFAGLVCALPPRLRVAAMTVTVVVLGLATERSVDTRYRRPAYRSVAALLDREARPSDPVILPTERYIFDAALPAHFHRPHRVLDRLPHRWPAESPGSHTYVVFDTAARPRIESSLRPPGWVLVGARSWNGLLDLTLLVYRAR